MSASVVCIHSIQTQIRMNIQGEIMTKNEKYIVDMYVRYFGKAPSVAEIAKYNDFKTPKLI